MTLCMTFFIFAWHNGITIPNSYHNTNRQFIANRPTNFLNKIIDDSRLKGAKILKKYWVQDVIKIRNSVCLRVWKPGRRRAGLLGRIRTRHTARILSCQAARFLVVAGAVALLRPDIPVPSSRAQFALSSPTAGSHPSQNIGFTIGDVVIETRGASRTKFYGFGLGLGLKGPWPWPWDRQFLESPSNSRTDNYY